MNENFVSTNSHVVRKYGRGFYIVSSKSRAGRVHFVDLETTPEQPRPVCTCEDKKYRGGLCRHCLAAAEALAEELTETQISQPPKQTKRSYALKPEKKFQ